jgi:hypothetical protein
VSREATDSVENRRQRVDTPSNDALQPYRIDQPNRLLGNGFSLPTKGTLDIPNIWRVNGSDSNTQDFRPEKAAKSGHEHVVTNSDTLWRIAKESLTANGDSASNTQISKRIQSIIKANAEEHPRLVRNPHSIPPGMKLHIPDNDGPQQPGRASQRREQSERPAAEWREGPERRERREPGDREKPAERQPASRDRQRPERDKVPHEASAKSSDRSRDKAASEGDGGRLARAMKQFGHDLADAAKRIAQSLGNDR